MRVASGAHGVSRHIQGKSLETTRPERTPYDLRTTTREHFAAEAYWRDKLPAEHKRTAVLTVGGCGSAVRVRNGELSIYEDGRERKFLPAVQPFKTLVVDAFGASITVDALAWLHRHNITAIILSDGEPVSITLPVPLYNLKIRRKQYAANLNPLPIARRIILQKIASGFTASRFSQADATHFKNVARNAADMKALLLCEAHAAIRYNSGMPITLRHKPKLWPPAWTEWTTRLSPIGGTSPRNAVHPINAVMNLAFTVAASQLTRNLAGHGLDPACGFLHSPEEHRASLAYDALELVRAVIDTKVCDFLASRTWTRADFPVTKSGIVRLQPSLARLVSARVAGMHDLFSGAAAWLAGVIETAR